METQQKQSFFAKMPAALLAVFVLIISYTVLFITDSIWTPRTATGLKSYLIYDLIIALGCFFIVRLHPKSYWFVPIICNFVLLVASITEPNLLKGPMLLPICGGWILSFVVSIITAQLTKRK